MKNRGLLSTLFAITVLFVLQMTISTATAATGGYSAQLISPKAGQVLHPGQKVKVEWKATFPNINLTLCEAEVWLSLDGGRTFTAWISPWMDPKTRFFYWTVPNTPTNAAVLDVRFGCEQFYPESYSPQPASTFVITKSAASSN
jgi:hypothetical protein